MSALELVVVSLVFAIGSTLQGAVGFGANLLAVPVLVLVDPTLVPGPTLVPALGLNLLVALRERGEGRLSEVAWALTGRVPGTVLGVWALALLPAGDLELVFGLLLLAGIAASATARGLVPTPPTLLGAGVASGFMGTVVSVGGPPIALVYQRASGPVLRATLARFFVAGTALSILALIVGGRLDGEGLANGLVLLPGTVAGFACSRPLARRVDLGWVRPAVLGLSTVAAVIVIVDWALT